MTNPFSFQPDKPVIPLGRFLGTPVAVQGWNALPVNQAIVWGLFTAQSTRKHAGWPAWRHLLLGGAKMVVSLGSEWCHNLAHVAAARAVGKPVDAVRVLFGMPVLLYAEPEHPSITPRQHILRSLGGPVCNLALLLASKVFQRLSPPGSPAREVADTAAVTNTFLASASLLPVSVFDGGPIAKWSLISCGLSPARSKTVIARTNRILGAGLAGASAAALCRRRWLLAGIFAFLGALSLAAGFGWMKDLASPDPAPDR
jgi:Zn-dependent protease